MGALVRDLIAEANVYSGINATRLPNRRITRIVGSEWRIIRDTGGSIIGVVNGVKYIGSNPRAVSSNTC
jgi:hypothetical protein